jgi:hypothetical protein
MYLIPYDMTHIWFWFWSGRKEKCNKWSQKEGLVENVKRKTMLCSVSKGNGNVQWNP